MKNQAPGKELYVTDISFDVTEEDLQKLFSVCGTVRSIHLLTDPKSGHFSGRAFVKMSSAAEAKDALNMLDGALLLNRCIKVSAARQKQAAPPATEAPPQRSRRPRRPKKRD